MDNVFRLETSVLTPYRVALFSFVRQAWKVLFILCKQPPPSCVATREFVDRSFDRGFRGGKNAYSLHDDYTCVGTNLRPFTFIGKLTRKKTP